MFYKSIGAVNTFCVILLTHEAQIVLTIAMKYLCDIGQSDDRLTMTSGLISAQPCAHPGTLTKNIFTTKYLISQINCRDNNSILSLLLRSLMQSLTNHNCRVSGT